ncbi:hypothetical protein AAFF_G00057690 [Aldrovandia affinis]|uniref:DROSHA n=1 Tax=Aldrovandia affinis TaxID=143900 RepID=A0AAD7WE24_9TELE|nr:hypothetical protein AAFF_G00057690 [Aldrovandia affinis]
MNVLQHPFSSALLHRLDALRWLAYVYGVKKIPCPSILVVDAPEADQGNSGYMTPRPDFMPYPLPVPSQGPSSLNQCPIRPPFPNPPIRQGFPEAPNFPPPPLPNSSGGSMSGSPASTPNAYHYMMPNVPPPPLPHPPVPPSMAQPMSYQTPYSMSYAQPPFPPPSFNPGYAQGSGSGSGSFKPDHFRHGGPYKAEKPPGERRSPERARRHEEPRHGRYGYGGHSDRHKMDYPPERKDRGRSPDRRRVEGSRHRTPPRHRSRDRSRERHRHRESRRSPSLDRAHRKRPRSRSSSRDRKRPRWEEERERRSEGAGASRERSHTALKSRDGEGASADRTEEEREEEELLKPAWIRCTHAENYYSNDPMDQVGDSTVVGTSKLRNLYERFEEELVRRQDRAKACRPEWEPPKTKLDEDPDESSSESDCESDGGSSCSSSSDSEVFDVIAEIKRKKAHPDRLHEELWYNDPGQMNDGPLCKCSAKARRTGIRHSIYPGEERVKMCRPMNNNAGKLFHYRVTVSPPTNFLTDRPTVIEYDDHEYLFEGFSLFSHMPLTSIPLCRVIRFNIDYTIHFIEEMTPENYCVKGLELFGLYLFKDILELYDWNLTGPEMDSESPDCQKFHFMPRFVRFLPGECPCAALLW